MRFHDIPEDNRSSSFSHDPEDDETHELDADEQWRPGSESWIPPEAVAIEDASPVRLEWAVDDEDREEFKAALEAFDAETSSHPSVEEMAVEVTTRALEVIGNEPEAMRWMGTPIRALNYATPISLLCDEAGRDAVITVLGQLEHGVL